jgi:hypothetical protein
MSEPLVAFWDTDTAALEHGIAQLLERLRDLIGIEVVVFATNSARRPTRITNVQALQKVLCLRR